MFRTLRASEIETRVQSCKANGCILLLFKDARCDMNILDETVTPLGWKREHLRDNKNCIVSIWNKDISQWVTKEDTGTESNTEQAKGLASDSFKRACFNWGIGRELYSAPFTWVNLQPNEVSQYNGKYKLEFKVKFKVSEITVDEHRQITHLIIVDQNNKVRFKLGQMEDYRSVFDDTSDKIVRQYLSSGKLLEIQRKELIKDLEAGKKVACKNLVDELIKEHGRLND